MAFIPSNKMKHLYFMSGETTNEVNIFSLHCQKERRIYVLALHNVYVFQHRNHNSRTSKRIFF